MDFIQRIKEYFKKNPETAKRTLIVLILVAIGLPGTLWFIYSAEEKAYVLFTNGYYAYRNRAYPQSAGQLNQLVSLYPNSKFTPMGVYYLALTHLANNSVDEAADQCKYFIDHFPKHFIRPRVFALSMALELTAGRPENTVALADRYLAEFGPATPSAPEILYRKGVALIQLGRKDEAEKCFEEAAPSRENNIFGNLAFFAQSARDHL